MSEKPIAIGDEMFYEDSRGNAFKGTVINTAPARLLDTSTGEVYAARKFYIWNEKRQRGMWTCAMRPTTPEPEGDAADLDDEQAEVTRLREERDRLHRWVAETMRHIDDMFLGRIDEAEGRKLAALSSPREVTE